MKRDWKRIYPFDPESTAKALGLLAAVTTAALWLVSAAPARAQTEDLPPSAPGYKPAVPELLSDEQAEELKVDHHWFTLRLGMAPIFDYTWFTQDQASVDQVGVQDDDVDVRSGRIMARGKIFADSKHGPGYLVAFEYRGFDSDPNHDWNFTDFSLTFPLGRIGDLTVGKTKEPFVYEMVGDAANLPHVERLMSRSSPRGTGACASTARRPPSARPSPSASTTTGSRPNRPERTAAAAGVERRRQLRRHRRHPGHAREPVRPRGAVGRRTLLAHGRVRRGARRLAGDRRPAVSWLLRDRCLDRHR